MVASIAVSVGALITFWTRSPLKDHDSISALKNDRALEMKDQDKYPVSARLVAISGGYEHF